MSPHRWTEREGYGPLYADRTRCWNCGSTDLIHHADVSDQCNHCGQYQDAP